MSFPKDFLWGGAVAANQCEGEWLTDGKLPNVTDVVVGIVSRKPGIKWNEETKKWEMHLDPNKKYLNFSKSYKSFDTVFNSIRLDQYQLSGRMNETVKSMSGFLKDSGYLDGGSSRSWKDFKDNYLHRIYFGYEIKNNVLSLYIPNKVCDNGKIDQNLVQVVK